jgi:hypothetical protein
MPPRQVDARKTRKALRKLRRAVESSKDKGAAAKLSDWEADFAQSVEKKLTTYGSAFRDAAKGRLEEPLSVRQAAKLGEIARKARGKGEGGLKRSAMKRSGPIKPKAPPKRAGRVRDIADEASDAPPPEPRPKRRRKR